MNKKNKLPKGYEFIFLLILFAVVVVIGDLFPKKDIFDYEERGLIKGIIINEKSKKNRRFFEYEFKYQELYFKGTISRSKTNCQVGDSCLIRFAIEDPSVNIFIKTIPK